jgi:hypothetical protein
MKALRRGHRLRREAIANVAIAPLRAIAVAWVIQIAGGAFAPAVLGAFMLARRVASTAASLLQLGASHALKRFVAGAGADAAEKRRYLAAALTLTGIAVSAVIAIVALLAKPLAEFIFTATPRISLIFATGALTIGTMASYLPFSWFLAERRIVFANVVEFASTSGFLILAFLVLKGSATPERVLGLQALGMVLVSMGVMTGAYRGLRDRCSDGAVLTGRAMQDAVAFGAPRSLVSFMDMLVLLIGPWLLRSDLAAAGYLIIALTIVRLVQSALAPLSQVASIATARLVGRGASEDVRYGTRLLTSAALLGGGVALAFCYPWLDRLLALWLPTPSLREGVAVYARVLLLGLIPYGVFQALKGVVEMRWITPWNLVSLGAAAAVQVLLSWLLGARFPFPLACVIAVTASFWVLGLLTLIWVREDLVPIRDLGVPWIVGAIGALWFANAKLAQIGSAWSALIGGGLVVVVLGSLLAVAPTSGLRAVRAFVFPRLG